MLLVTCWSLLFISQPLCLIEQCYYEEKLVTLQGQRINRGSTYSFQEEVQWVHHQLLLPTTTTQNNQSATERIQKLMTHHSWVNGFDSFGRKCYWNECSTLASCSIPDRFFVGSNKSVISIFKTNTGRHLVSVLFIPEKKFKCKFLCFSISFAYLVFCSTTTLREEY